MVTKCQRPPLHHGEAMRSLLTNDKRQVACNEKLIILRRPASRIVKLYDRPQDPPRSSGLIELISIFRLSVENIGCY